jgi:hypothetical protein
MSSIHRNGPPRAARVMSAVAQACALTLLMLTLPAHAADEPGLAQLRLQIEQMRQQYEARLLALEQRVKVAEAQAAQVPQPSPQVAVAPQPESSAAPRGGDNGFNPAVSLVLSGTYAQLSRDPGTWKMSGFAMGSGEVGPGDKGLALGESELSLSANIDPWWYGALTFSLDAQNEVSVEEAVVQTTALSDGVKVKVGRFLSGVGYLNEQHAHTWDFVDAPLVYQAFLGGPLKQDGAQAKWLLPTDQFVELGAEVARGASARNGAGTTALFAHVGGDVGASNSWRAGVSQLWAHPVDRTWEDTDLSGQDVSNAFTGRSRTWVLDGVWKWAPNGNAKVTSFKLQGEYFRRTEQGAVAYDVNDVSGHGALTDGYKATQSGWYLQGIYQFAPGWRVGLRHDQLDVGVVDYGANNLNIARPDAQPQRTSAMLDWSLSEFSRWRLQLNDDRARQGVSDTQIYLQYQMSLGAHGAHSF